MVKKISHIGIAVKNLEEAIKFYEKLGFYERPNCEFGHGMTKKIVSN